MLRRSVSILTVLLYGVLAFPGKVRAETALTQAVVQSIQNQVQLLLQSESSRSARVSDVLVPGDGLTTANDSLAELRFNDGSLGRLGEQVIFWFTPGTRNFSLSNGTVLLLIPPGQGRTTIQTPNASAGIQGSALFVRYIEETDTTVVGALTDSNIQVVNEDGTQQYTLAAGEMAVAVGDRITSIYEFDLQTFYETSNLARDLAPDSARDRDPSSSGNPNSTSSNNTQAPARSSDPAISAVQAEMDTALQQQDPITAAGSIETPDFLRMRDSSSSDRPDPASDPLAPGNSGVDTRSPGPDRATSGNPVNDPGRAPLGQPQGRDLDQIPPDRGPRNNPGNGSDGNPGTVPGSNPGNGPGNNPGNGPGSNPGNGPGNNPGSGPGNNPGSGPGSNPGNGPGNNPGSGPGNNPGNGPGNNPGNGPGSNPGNGPGNNPGSDPGNNPGNGPGSNPGNGPGENPGSDPGENPGNGPGENPGSDPSENPGNGPGENPGSDPGENPGNGPGENPGNDPDNNGNGPNDNPGRGPNDNPGRGPNDNPGRGPNDNPGRGPNDNPGRGPNDNPGRGPNDNPGLGPNDNPGRGPNDNPGRGSRIDAEVGLPGLDLDVEVER